MKRFQFAAILFSLNLMGGATAFCAVDRFPLEQKAASFVKQTHMRIEPVASEIAELALEVQQMNGDVRGAPEVRELVELVEENIDALLRDGEVVSIAMAAWALSSHKLPQARSLVSLLEIITDDEGRVKHCKAYCKEALTLSYLSMIPQNPKRAQALEKQLEKFL